MGTYLDFDAIRVSVSIEDVLGYYNIEINQRGFCSIRNEKEASCKVYKNTNSYYDWGARDGGDVIKLVSVLEQCGNYEAARLLNDTFLRGEAGIESTKGKVFEQKQEDNKEKILVLPEVSENFRIGRAYLTKTRGLSNRIVDYFVNDLKILYESSDYHNLVFLGKSASGEIKFASKRGTRDIYGDKFKGDCEGSNKNYGVNIATGDDTVCVFEAAIDCMSYMDIMDDYKSNKLVLGGLCSNALDTFLEEHSEIKKIIFCVDNDEPALKALYGDKEKEGLLKIYREKGYDVKKLKFNVPNIKDCNEMLLYLKENAPYAIAASKYEHMSRKSVNIKSR